MPKKKGKKKGKKSKGVDPEAEAAAKELAERAEAKRRYEEEQAAREATLVLREEALAKREQETEQLEGEFTHKLQSIDEEVTARVRSAIAAADSREAACSRRAKQREADCLEREACFATAERELAQRALEVEARERAMDDDGASKGVHERLDKMLSEQAVTRDAMLAREKEIGRARGGLRAREEALRDEVGKAETELAQRERDARLRVEQQEKGLVRKTFMLKRRLAGRIKEVEAIVESHRAECDVVDLPAEEPELEQIYRPRSPSPEAPARPSPELEAELRAFPGTDPAAEADAIAAALKDASAADRLLGRVTPTKPRPFAARHLPGAPAPAC